MENEKKYTTKNESSEKKISKEYQESIDYLNSFLSNEHPTMNGFFYTGAIEKSYNDKISAYNTRTTGIVQSWFGERLPTAINKLKETEEFKITIEKYPNVEELANKIIEHSVEIMNGLKSINHEDENISNLIKEEAQGNSNEKFNKIIEAYEAIKDIIMSVVNPSDIEHKLPEK